MHCVSYHIDLHKINSAIYVRDLFLTVRRLVAALHNLRQPSQGSLIGFRGLVSNLTPSYCGASTATRVIDTESKTATYKSENVT